MKYFTSIALLLFAILATIMQVATAAEESDAGSTSVSTQDLWKSLYDKYYSNMASPALAARDVAEPAQLFPPIFPPTFPPTFPPIFPPTFPPTLPPPPVVIPPFPPFPPPPTFPPFPPPPTFPPFPPFPPRY